MAWTQWLGQALLGLHLCVHGAVAGLLDPTALNFRIWIIGC
jgi:hypothetical protein